MQVFEWPGAHSDGNGHAGRNDPKRPSKGLELLYGQLAII